MDGLGKDDMRPRLAWLAGLGIALAAVPAAWAGQALNPQTGKWETVAPGSTLQYNAQGQSWEYAPPGAKPVLNPMTGKWELAPDGTVPTFNPDSNSWSMELPGTRREFNPYTQRSEFPN